MSTPIQNIPSTNISTLIPNNYTALIKKPVTYYYDICGNELYNSFSPISLLPSKCQIPFIGKSGIPYSPNYTNTTISTFTLNSPNAITFDKKYNNAYISSSSTLYKFDLYTGVITIVAGNYYTGSITALPISSYSPVFASNNNINTAFDPSGYLYIADSITCQISKMDLNTSMITNLVYTDTINKPLYVLIDNSFNLYYSSTTGVYKTSLLDTLPVTSTIAIDSNNIYQMAFAPGDQRKIYGCCPTTPASICVCDTITPELSYSITFPSGIGINNGQGLIFDSFGNLYICTRFNIYLLSNAVLSAITTNTILTTQQYVIYSNSTLYNGGLRWLSIDNANNLYVTDVLNNIIYKFINNTYNTNYLLPSELDLGTTFIPKMMLGGTSSRIGSFPISNYIVDSLDSPIEYYIEGATYNIIDNSGLICHYMFNVQDISGVNIANYASGSFLYDASLSVAGLGYRTDYMTGNGCLNLTAASSQYVQVNTSAITKTAWPPTGGGGVTFACWVKPRTFTGNMRLFDFGNGADIDNIMILYNSTGQINANVYVGGISSGNVNWGVSLKENHWYHIAWVLNWNGTNGDYTLYVNGISKGTITGKKYPATTTRTKCYIGKSNWSDPYNNGQIDDFRIYNRPITAEEAFVLYSFNQLSHYYKFDWEDIFKGDVISIANYASGYPIYDASLSAANSQMNGITRNSYMTGNACMCLSGNYLNIPTPNISTNGFTVAFWMNTTSANTNFPALLYLTGNTGNTDTYIYINNIGGAVLTYECRYNDTRTLLDSTIPINDGIWHHVVLTSTYSIAGTNSSTIQLYIDNVLNTSTTAGYYPSSLSNSSYIGYNTTSMYNGQIDDFRIYSRVLSSPEIDALYNYTYNPNKLDMVAANPIYSTPATPILTVTSTTATNSIGVSTQSYSNDLTTGCYFYYIASSDTVGSVYQGRYSSNIYSITLFNDISLNISYSIACNVFNISNVSSIKTTTIPSASLTTTSINNTSIVFTDTTDYIGVTSYQIKLYTNSYYTGTTIDSSGIPIAGANNTTTVSGLTANTQYWYQVIAINSTDGTIVTTYSTNSTTSTFTSMPSASLTAININDTSITFADATNYIGLTSYQVKLYTNYAYAGTTIDSSGTPIVGANNTIHVSGLTANKQYWYQVIATNTNNTTGQTVTTNYAASSVFTAIQSASLNATTKNTTSIVFTDSATYAGLTAYQVKLYRNTDYTGTTIDSSGSPIVGTNKTITISGLTANTQYWYQVIATNTNNTTGQVQTTNYASTSVFTAIPSASVTATTKNDTSIVFTDATTYTGLTAYQIKLYTNSAYTGTTIDSSDTLIDGSNQLITVSGLTSNTQYWYQVIATNTNNSTGQSVTTNFAASSVFTAITTASLFAATISTNTIAFTDTATYSGLTAYKIKLYSNSAYTGTTNDSTAAPIVGSNKTIAVSGLTPNKQYWCQVVATNTSNTTGQATITNFADSLIFTAIPSASLTATTKNANSIVFTDATNYAGLTAYQIKLYTNSDYTGTTIDSSGTPIVGANKTITVSGLTANTQYWYQAIATNTNNTTEQSQITNYAASPVFTAIPSASLFATTKNTNSVVFINATNYIGLTAYQIKLYTTSAYTGTTIDSSDTPIEGAINSITVSNLISNKQYWYQVIATNTNNTTGQSITTNNPTLSFFTAITSASLTAVTKNTTSIIFTDATNYTGLTSYKIKLYSNSAYTGITIDSNGTPIVGADQLITVSGLTANKQYWYQVVATNTNNSTGQAVTTNYADSSVFTAIQSASLTATTKTDTSITFKDAANYIGLTSYQIKLYTNTNYTGTTIDSSGTPIAGANQLITVSELAPNTQYWYQVIAINTNNSTGDTAKTEYAASPVFTAIPSASLIATTKNDTSIIFTDATNYTGLTAYQIKLYTNSTYSGATINSTSTPIDGSNQLITVSGLTANKQYWYQVVATNTNNSTGQIVTTNYASSSVFTAITTASLTVSNKTDTSIIFTDATNYAGLTAYQIKLYTASDYSGTTINSSAAAIVGANKSITVSGLTANREYWYQVVATNTSNTTEQALTTNYADSSVFTAISSASLTAITKNDTSIIFKDTINYIGLTAYQIKLYTNSAYTGTTIDSSGTPIVGANQLITVSGLTENKQYWYQVVATNTNNTTGQTQITNYAAISVFTAMPSASLNVSNKTDTSIIFTDTTNYTGLTAYKIRLFTTSAYTGTTIDSSGVPIVGANNTITVSGLTANKEYWYQAVATNTSNTTGQNVTTNYAASSVFTAITTASLTVTTKAATSIIFTDATTYAGLTAYQIKLYTNSAYTGTTIDSSGTPIVGANKTITVSNLTPNAQYWYQAIATNTSNTTGQAAITNYANSSVFTAIPSASLTATTKNANSIVFTDATTYAGLTAYQVKLYTASAYTGTTIDSSNTPITGTNKSITVFNLTSNKQYWYQVIASNTSNTTGQTATTNYATSSVFTAIPSASITATTKAATSIVFTDATTYAGLTAYQIKLYINSGYTGTSIDSATTAIVGVNKTVSVSSLTANTQYWYQAIATNTSNTTGQAVTTKYATTSVFTAIPSASLTATTKAATSITFTDATTYAGLTAYQIKLYTNSAYTGTSINSATAAIVGVNKTVSVSGLTANTQYWYQAIATNTSNTTGQSVTTNFASSPVFTTK